ncbi:hypothetical protein D6C81_07839 [Aureobasidium pullulans]|uniref:Uncharacterized protein n=1 Tax=Aureobasidium pullulans TaxID=5580 RepID=A0A4S9ZVG4_AURPU|nr:hypothetical protein D6D28_07459 [Aureobasidium pullulans]TIA11666.1 hypothetical protein D6C81_07839 [Aureobasidium pullulans]
MSDNETNKETAAEDADVTYTRHFSDFVSSCGQVGGEVAWTTVAELLDRERQTYEFSLELYPDSKITVAFDRTVLAHGPSNRLYHAEKAVEHAEWDVRNFGDQYGGLKLLALAKRTLEDLLEGEPIYHTGQGTTGHEGN